MKIALEKKVVKDVHHKPSLLNRCIIDSLVAELNVQQSPVDQIVADEMPETLHALSQETQQHKFLKTALFVFLRQGTTSEQVLLRSQ